MTRLALTSTSRRNRALAGIARRLALEPVDLPCIEIVIDPDGPAVVVEQLGRADLLVLGSSRTPALLPEGSLRRAPPVLAVGAATARAAAEAGLTVVAVGVGGIDRLVEDHGDRLEGRDVLFAGSANLLDRTVTALARRARRARGVALYHAVPRTPAETPVDAVVFGSPTAVRGWCSARDLDGMVVAAVGTTTAAALREVGVTPDVVPETAGFVGAIEGVAASRPERSMR